MNGGYREWSPSTPFWNFVWADRSIPRGDRPRVAGHYRCDHGGYTGILDFRVWGGIRPARRRSCSEPRRLARIDRRKWRVELGGGSDFEAPRRRRRGP